MSHDDAQLAPGRTVYLRHWQRDQLGLLFPIQVVDQRSDGLLLWAPAGTQGWHLNMPDGRTMNQTPLQEWSAVQRVPVKHTVTHGALSWHPVGLGYSIRWFFDSEGAFYGWYANLEAPAVIGHDGGLTVIDTVDWDLDVVIHPDRTWEWKDEDEFAARLAMRDAYWVDDEVRVRGAGMDVIKLVETGRFPFDGTWCNFRPNPTWPTIPSDLPAGWNRPRSTRQ